jgi:hypothetical protein
MQSHEELMNFISDHSESKFLGKCNIQLTANIVDDAVNL